MKRLPVSLYILLQSGEGWEQVRTGTSTATQQVMMLPHVPASFIFVFY